jgi:hypothetical protein
VDSSLALKTKRGCILGCPTIATGISLCGSRSHHGPLEAQFGSLYLHYYSGIQPQRGEKYGGAGDDLDCPE